LRRVLADWDPTRDDRGLAPAERQAVRGRLMASVHTGLAAPAAGVWRGLALAGAVAVLVMVGVWTPSIVRFVRLSDQPERDIELRAEHAPAEAATGRVQIQMRTKGGTQIVWFVEKESADAQ
jgi:hypothetical protein